MFEVAVNLWFANSIVIVRRLATYWLYKSIIRLLSCELWITCAREWHLYIHTWIWRWNLANSPLKDEVDTSIPPRWGSITLQISFLLMNVSICLYAIYQYVSIFSRKSGVRTSLRSRWDSSLGFLFQRKNPRRWKLVVVACKIHQFGNSLH